MKNNDSNDNELLKFVLKECIHALFFIGVPFLINLIINKKRDKTTNEETFENIKDDFETGHDWS